MSENDLAALVCSRMCHDLVSPIGAIGNGVELLELSDQHSSVELSLISDSVQQANARIRLFRLAFGQANLNQTVPRTEVLSVLTALASGGRSAYMWKVSSDHSRHAVRCALLALLCLESALPLGGDITITEDADNWRVTAVADRINRKSELWQHLELPETYLMFQPNTVQFALLPQTLAEVGRSVTIEQPDDTTLTLRF